MNTASPALLAANRKLHQQRAMLAEQRGINLLPWQETETAVSEPEPATTADCIRQLPDHLGWGSDAITAVVRDSARRQQAQQAAAENWPTPAPEATVAKPEAPEPTTEPDIDGDLRLYPDIALGMLREEQAAAGRVWLLLHYLDSDGRGWVPVEEARDYLARKESPLRIVGWRQLRNLLREGQGLFWERDAERIWLKSAAKVAAALGVAKLTGRPVALPVQTLCAGMGLVKAHFYASFHSGRKDDTPINRVTLEAISGVPARTQLAYEKMTGTGKRRNIAIGERYSQVEIQKRAWIHGKAAFDFIDHQGFQGEARQHYVAWWLPNSYSGCHRQCGKGRQRKINRRIDLVIKGRGNGSAGLRSKLFHTDGSKAAKAYEGKLDRFWPSGKTPVKSKRLWYSLTGWEVGNRQNDFK